MVICHYANHKWQTHVFTLTAGLTATPVGIAMTLKNIQIILSVYLKYY